MKGFPCGRRKSTAGKRTAASVQNNDVLTNNNIKRDAITNNSIRNDAIIIEFKVQSEGEGELSDTVREALRQIEEKNYQVTGACRLQLFSLIFIFQIL